MRYLRICVLVVFVTVTVGLAGCGGGTRVETSQTQTTIGQELMDLEKAHKEGIISDKEYDAQKKKILKRK
jgi:hypothetical protein